MEEKISNEISASQGWTLYGCNCTKKALLLTFTTKFSEFSGTAFLQNSPERLIQLMITVVGF